MRRALAADDVVHLGKKRSQVAVGHAAVITVVAGTDEPLGGV